MSSKEQIKQQLESQIKVLQDELNALNEPAPKERHPDDEQEVRHADRKSTKSDR